MPGEKNCLHDFNGNRWIKKDQQMDAIAHRMVIEVSEYTS